MSRVLTQDTVQLPAEEDVKRDEETGEATRDSGANIPEIDEFAGLKTWRNENEIRTTLKRVRKWALSFKALESNTDLALSCVEALAERLDTVEFELAFYRAVNEWAGPPLNKNQVRILRRIHAMEKPADTDVWLADALKNDKERR